MDKEALRAMMPLSFGKKGPKKMSNQQTVPQNRTAVAESSKMEHKATEAPIGSSTGGPSNSKRRHEEAEEDDGLTAEEREANAAIEERLRENGTSTDSNSSDDDDDDIGPQPITVPDSLPPMTNEAAFTGHHSKTISALAVDQSGARFCIGSYDYNLSLYDFGGMNAALSPFRSFEPAETYPVYDVAFSSDSRNVLVVSGTAQAKMFSRDGVDLGTCKKGDPYLRDMRNTTGHVSDLSCGKCHPLDGGVFMTGGSDSTIRIWDLATMERAQTDIIVLKSKNRGNRTKVTSVQYSTEGRRIFGAGLDGSLSYWDTRSNLNAKPRGCIESAHTLGTITSSIAVSNSNENLVATRGGDHTVKLWDLRHFKQPLSMAHGLANTSAHTDVIFNPIDGRTLLTCVSALPLDRKGNVASSTNLQEEDDDTSTTNTTGGKIAVLSPIAAKMDVVKMYSISAVSPVRLAWCVPTNQLFTTFRDGSIRVFYDPTTSTKGVTMAVSRAPRKHTPWSTDTSLPSEASISLDQIYTPGSQDIMQSESAKRRKLAKIRQDPIKSNLPQRPVQGVGQGGRIGAAANTHIVQNMYNNQSTANEDPREALLKYATQQDPE